MEEDEKEKGAIAWKMEDRGQTLYCDRVLDDDDFGSDGRNRVGDSDTDTDADDVDNGRRSAEEEETRQVNVRLYYYLKSTLISFLLLFLIMMMQSYLYRPK